MFEYIYIYIQSSKMWLPRYVLQRNWTENLYLIFVFICAVYTFWISYAILRQSDQTSVNVYNRANNQLLSWLHRRVELIAQNTSTKVLLFCYMRGGSSLAGEMFNTDQDAVLWYEPLAAFYAAYYGLKYASKPHNVLYTASNTRSITDPQEQKWMTKYLANILECKLDRLPAQGWLHPFVGNGENLSPIKYCVKMTTSRDPMRRTCPSTMDVCEFLDQAKANRCPEMLSEGRKALSRKSLRNLTGEDLKDIMLKNVPIERIDPATVNRASVLAENMACIEKLRKRNSACVKRGVDVCRKKSLHVAEVLRMKMEDVEAVLLENPDMYIVHYVRDPRGIALSRVSTAHLMVDANRRSAWYEAACVCQQMRMDLKHRRHLELKYPGVVVQVRYEDLVLNPVETVRGLYKRIGRRLTETSSWEQFARQAFSSQDGERQFGTMRQNGSESVEKWRTAISHMDLQRIKSSCKDVLVHLGYPVS